MAGSAETELYDGHVIVEEPLPYFPPHPRKVALKLSAGIPLDQQGGSVTIGYALECNDRDMDICINEGFYRGGLKDAINEIVDKILGNGDYCTQRVLLVNGGGGITRVLQNFTGRQKR
jgi:hypothetical protein